MEASEAQAPETQSQEGQESQAPDVTKQLADLQQLVETRLPEQQEQPDDFAEQWLSGWEDTEEEPQQDFAEQPEEGGEDDGVQELLGLIGQEAGRIADERVGQVLSAQQEQENLKQISALGEEFPELRDEKVFNQVIDTVDQIADAHGSDALAMDPRIIRLAYQAYRAQQAANNETPAEAAAQKGASLEKGAGPSDQGDSEIEDIKRKIVGADAGSSTVFGT